MCPHSRTARASSKLLLHTTLLITLASLPLTCRAVTARALSIPPSTTWYGDDGTWSAISIRVGTPVQWVDVLPNTRSSETWVVSVGGCGEVDPLCTASRGGVFDSRESSTFEPLGFYELGVNNVLGNTGYADYGLDSLTYGSTGVSSPSSIIGTVNGTGMTYIGSFGLGIVPGSFNSTSHLSAISSLVEVQGEIESHSYGFTAGAKYQQKGVPASLTLGGFDANRLVPNNVTFSLNPEQQPQSQITAISLVSSAQSATGLKTPVQLLSNADRVSAVIDSSTPYLWFPRSVCERFADALKLTYDTSLNLYTFGGDQSQLEILRDAQLTFTFTLSDLSSSEESVDIILGYEAFDLQLTYPAIPNTTYGGENSTMYYFPLRQATNEAQYRIGRVFLQEAYLITDYDRNTFSVHQAVHTSDPVRNISIVAILRDDSTHLSGSPVRPKKSLSAGAIAGIVIGAIIGLAVIIFAIYWFLRSRRRTNSVDSDDEKPGRFRSRNLLDIVLRRGGPKSTHSTSADSPSAAVEVGADASHERFELPAPLGPAELDSESWTLDGSTQNGSTQDSANMSAYERARRKLELQQAAGKGVNAPISEKTEYDVSQVAHYRPPEYSETPLISPLGVDSIGSIVSGQPSPLSPMSPGFPARDSTAPRIAPMKVVYAGSLPDNVQLPTYVPKVVDRNGRTIRSEASDPAGLSSDDDPGSLGSNFTDNQGLTTGDVSNNSNTQSAVSPVSNETGSGSGARVGITAREPRGDAMSSQRRLDGDDLIHVPQPAENRFSFEEERISGNENSL